METTETPPVEEPKPRVMPPPVTAMQQQTWHSPTLVENVKPDVEFITFQVRPGRSLMVNTRHELTFSDERPPSEDGLVFRIHPANRIGLTESVSINALTDEVRIGDLFWQATTPKASEYRKAIGTERMIHSQTIPNPNQTPGEPLFVTNRVFLVIP